MNPVRLLPPSLPSPALPRPKSTLAHHSFRDPRVIYRDAVLSSPPSSLSACPPPPRPSTKVFPSQLLPPLPPRSLRNPSLSGRCFCCFEKGHRAAHCREPRRCLLCMRLGHAARYCKARPPPIRGMDGLQASGRPISASALLDCSQSPSGVLALAGRVALVEALSQHPERSLAFLPQGLAARFGGSCADYKVAPLKLGRAAVFFPNWVARESAISRSPIQLEEQHFRFTSWVEPGEGDRDLLIHKVWIKLHNWPIIYWNTEDVRAAVSSFGALWEVDENSKSLREVSFFRVLIRCRHYRSIPKTLLLSVEDRRFSVRVEIDSWVDAEPILLSEAIDRRLGLDSVEAQANFIRCSGFGSSAPYGGAQGAFASHDGGATAGSPHRGSGERRPVCPSVHGVALVSNLELLDFPPLPSYSRG